MLKLIYYQWRYSWKEWTATVPVFFMASLISGISLSGDFNIIANKDVLLSVQTDPSPVFLMPIFFGGLTLFLIISSLIASLLDYFKSDYQLWEILGANRWQLSILVAGQISLMAFISSIPGALIATPISRYYYYYLQKYFGKGMMPDLNFGSQPLALLATVALISSLAFVSGYFYTSKLLKQKVERKTFKFWSSPMGYFSCPICFPFIYVLSFRTIIGYWFLALPHASQCFCYLCSISLSSNWYYQTFITRTT